MNKIASDFFLEWNYDQSLLWMQKAREKVLKNPFHIYFAIGSYRQPVITLGRNKEKNYINSKRIHPDVVIKQLERGGGPTAHEYGQLVLYPVLNIKSFSLSVKDFISILLRTMQRFLHSYCIYSTISNDSLGVFIQDKKIGFLGMRIKENITSHGIALNVLNNLYAFKLIDPCGIKGLKITAVKDHVTRHFGLKNYALQLSECFLTELNKLPTLRMNNSLLKQ